MKIASLLLCLYLVVTVVYPCNDHETCADEVKAGFTVTDNDSHPHSNQEQDFCSPLCICSCCAAACQLTYSLEVALSFPPSRSADPTLYAESLQLDNGSPIWQPPKIS